jgi:hypothetical protein
VVAVFIPLSLSCACALNYIVRYLNETEYL